MTSKRCLAALVVIVLATAALIAIDRATGLFDPVEPMTPSTQSDL